MNLGIIRDLEKLGAHKITTGRTQDNKVAVLVEQTVETCNGSGRIMATHQMGGEDHAEALQAVLAQVQHVHEVGTKLRIVGNGR